MAKKKHSQNPRPSKSAAWWGKYEEADDAFCRVSYSTEELTLFSRRFHYLMKEIEIHHKGECAQVEGKDIGRLYALAHRVLEHVEEAHKEIQRELDEEKLHYAWLGALGGFRDAYTPPASLVAHILQVCEDCGGELEDVDHTSGDGETIH